MRRFDSVTRGGPRKWTQAQGLRLRVREKGIRKEDGEGFPRFGARFGVWRVGKYSGTKGMGLLEPHLASCCSRSRILFSLETFLGFGLGG